MAFKDNFRGDSAYTQIMTKIFNIFWLSILWLLCCIPVITIGASTIALYYVMLKLVKDEETTVTREFFHSFKQNFLQSLPVTVIVLVVVVVLALYSLKTALAALKEDKPTAKETPYEPMPENLEEIVTQAKGAH